jgi:hypothetical protein
MSRKNKKIILDENRQIMLLPQENANRIAIDHYNIWIKGQIAGILNCRGKFDRRKGKFVIDYLELNQFFRWEWYWRDTIIGIAKAIPNKTIYIENIIEKSVDFWFRVIEELFREWLIKKVSFIPRFFSEEEKKCENIEELAQYKQKVLKKFEEYKKQLPKNMTLNQVFERIILYR